MSLFADTQRTNKHEAGLIKKSECIAATVPLALDLRLTGGARNPLSHSHPLFTWNNELFCVYVCVSLTLALSADPTVEPSSAPEELTCVCVCATGSVPLNCDLSACTFVCLWVSVDVFVHEM